MLSLSFPFLGLMLAIVLMFGVVGCGSADQQALQGAWMVRAVEMDGKPYQPLKHLVDNKVNALDIAGITYIFDGDSVTLREPDASRQGGPGGAPPREHKGTFRLDPAREPREIDMWLTDDAGKEKKVYGIYKIENDTLHLCLAQVEAMRPLEFRTRPNEDRRVVYLICKRPEKE